MWFWLSLVSAVFGAVTIIFSKKALEKVSAAAFGFAVYSLSIPLVILLFYTSEGIPQINFTFWIAVIASSLTFVVGQNIINNAMRNNLVSQIIPLTTFSVVFSYFFGLILLSESLKIVPFSGLALVLFGSYILNVEAAKEDILKPFKLLFLTKSSLLFLFALMLIGLTVIFDKMAIINTSPTSPFFALLLEQLLMSLLLFIYLIAYEKKTWIPEIKQNLGILFIVSTLYLIIGYILFVAYAQGPAALIIGIKRIQIFFALVLGYLFLKDKPGRYIWIGTVVMILGTILIKVG